MISHALCTENGVVVVAISIRDWSVDVLHFRDTREDFKLSLLLPGSADPRIRRRLRGKCLEASNGADGFKLHLRVPDDRGAFPVTEITKLERHAWAD